MVYLSLLSNAQVTFLKKDSEVNISELFYHYRGAAFKNHLRLYSVDAVETFLSEAITIFTWWHDSFRRVGTLIVTTIYLQLIQNRYLFRSFTVLHCSHQHCVQPVASDVEVIGYF